MEGVLAFVPDEEKVKHEAMELLRRSIAEASATDRAALLKLMVIYGESKEAYAAAKLLVIEEPDSEVFWDLLRMHARENGGESTVKAAESTIKSIRKLRRERKKANKESRGFSDKGT